jgi:putative ABC transport system permease protein
MIHDVSYAIRSLRRQPGFALLAIVVLALGIGSAAAIATVYNAVLLRPLPMREQDRLVVMWGVNRARKFDHIPVFNRQVRAFEERSRAFSSVATADYNGAWPRLFRDKGEPIELVGAAVSGDFFEVLGTTPSIGRVLRPEDDVPGAAPSMVISHSAWRQRFGGDTAILGRQLQLVASGSNFTIVGVLPPGFEYPKGAELWASIHGMIEAKNADPRALVDVIGRLRSGATLEMARREMEALFAEDTGAFFRGVTAVAHTVPDRVIGDVRPALRILAVAVGLLLLVACVNVANLFLIRGVERSREMAVRSALGAGRARLTRQLLTESSLVGLMAGIAGGLLAMVLLRVLMAAAPAELPRLGEIHLASTAVWAAAATFVASALFGIAPALWTAGKRVGANLVGSSRWATERGGERLVKDLLVAGQLALAILILTSAGLVARSLLRLQQLELGYSSDRLLVAQLAWPHSNFSTTEEAVDTYQTRRPF